MWVSAEIGATVSVIDTTNHQIAEKITFDIPGIRPELIQPLGSAVLGTSGEDLTISKGGDGTILIAPSAPKTMRTAVAWAEVEPGLRLHIGLEDPADLIADLRRASHHVKILVLSASLDPSGIEKARSAGADVIMDKLTPVGEVLATVRRLGNT